MARLYRPYVPLEVRCRVAMKALGELWPDQLLEEMGASKTLLTMLLTKLAAVLVCDVTDLRLDHDPPLGLRPQERRGLGRKTYYVPDANDPEHLFYRPHGTQFAGSHDVKTRIRGDRGQFSDVTLIKRQRRRDRKAKPVKRRSGSRPKLKVKWPKGRKLQSRNTWPKKQTKRR